MADNNHAVIKIRTDHNENAIEDINHNFRVLTERIKDLNLTISYMDLLRLQEVYEVNLVQEESVRLQNFVSNCWGKLPNYSGVAFSTTGTGDLPLFEFLGHQVSTRDFLVKLPDDQCLYIRGVESQVYVPSYDASEQSLSYTLTPITLAPTTIPAVQVNTEPSIAVTASFVGVAYVSPGSSFDTQGHELMDTRWFTLQGEEVLWTGSHETDQNTTALSLMALYYAM